MSPLLLFAGSAAGLCVVALILVLPVLLRRRESIENGADIELRTNIAAARERLADMRARRGELDEATAIEYEQEIQAQLLRDTTVACAPVAAPARSAQDWSGAALVVAVLALVVPLTYALVGEVAAVGYPEQQLGARLDSALSVPELTARLEERVATAPDDVTALVWLGRLMVAQQRHADAADYFAQAIRLQPQRPELLAAQINALLLAGSPNHDQLDRLLTDALATYPADPAMRWLAGLYADSQGDIGAAVTYWRSALELLDDDSQQRAQIIEAIAAAQSQLAVADNTATGSAMEVVVDIAPQFSGSSGTLFVLAKAVDANITVPLAVRRLQAASYPLTVRLDDSAAIDPELTLSKFALYDIEARLSESGNTLSRSGDRYGEARQVKPNAAVTVIIASTVP